MPGLSVDGAASLLAFPFPPIKPVGVLAVFWCRKGHQDQLAKQISTLRYIGELVAALGERWFRQVLEGRIVTGTEDIAEALPTARKGTSAARRGRGGNPSNLGHGCDDGTVEQARVGSYAERSFKVARRQGMPASLFADIDGLKTVNDELGHDAGDHVILGGARIFQISFRDSDVLARLGGARVCPAFTLGSTQPQVILARIQEKIQGLHQHSSLPYQISFSTGIVQCDPLVLI